MRSRRSATFSVLLTATALAGCGSMMAPTLPDRLPDQLPARFAHAGPAATAPDAAAADPHAAAAPELRAWWKHLGDARLDALVEQALSQNLALAQAGSRLRQARRLSLTSDATYRPLLGSGVRTLQDVSATDVYLHASLDVTWELGLFGMREGARQVARAAVQSSIAAEQAARVAVVAETVRQYLVLRAAQAQSQILQRLSALDARALALAAVRQRSALSGTGEADEARARQAQTAALLPAARQAAVQASQALAMLLGRDAPDAAWNLPADLPLPTGLAGDAVPADLLRTRPDIADAEAAVLQAAGEMGMARAELYPRIALGASYLYAFNITQNRRSSRADQIPLLGPAIDLPLFDWGLRKARADARGEALQASLLAYRQTVLQAVSETETALSALAEQRQRAGQLDTARAALQQRASAQRGLLTSGLSSPWEQLGPDRAALLAELECQAGRANEALAFVDLYRALGGAPLPDAAPLPPKEAAR